jgi:ELWxxDGT repeat protein
MVRDLTAGPDLTLISGIVGVQDTAYVAVVRRGLWRSDGTAAGTRRVGTVREVVPSGPEWPTMVAKGRTLFFVADDRVWRTDGTDAGTTWLTPKQAFLSDLTLVNGRLVFFGDEPSDWCCGERHLWLSNGTRAGTERATFDMVGGSDLTRLGPWAYFVAAIPGKAPRMFRTDGTQPGTGPVMPRTRPPIEANAAGGSLWFSTGGTDETDDTLWTSDGTNAGTQRVFGGAGDWHLWQGAAGRFVAFDGRVWFAAGPGDPWTFTDLEPWVTDGTEAGTSEAVDLAPAGSSSPDDLVTMGGALYLTADDGTHGRELWRIDP